MKNNPSDDAILEIVHYKIIQIIEFCEGNGIPKVGTIGILIGMSRKLLEKEFGRKDAMRLDDKARKSIGWE